MDYGFIQNKGGFADLFKNLRRVHGTSRIKDGKIITRMMILAEPILRMRQWENCIDKREYMFYYMNDDPDGFAEPTKHSLK